jgi:O-antigen/teichoic acid export membrane protein
MISAYPLTRRIVVKNIAALFSGSALAQGLTALVYLILARQLGAPEFGKFTSSLALASITSLLFNLGLDTWLLHVGGKQPAAIPRFTGSVVAIKGVLGLLWFVLLMLLSPLLNQNTFPFQVLLWTAVTVWLDSMLMTLLTAFKANLQNRYPLILEPATDLVWLLGTIGLILVGTSTIVPYLVLRAIVLACGLITSGLILGRVIGVNLSQDTARQALRESPPYASSELLAMTTMRLDLLIVALFLGSEAAGVYSPALAVVNTLFFVPAAIANVMIPVLSYLYQHHVDQARRTASRQIWLQLMVGILLFAGFYLFSPSLVRFLGASYQDSLILMRILSFVLLLKPITFAMAAILVASQNQRRRVYIQVIAAIASVLLDLIAVYWFNLPAVAIVYVLVELILISGYGWVVYRYAPHKSTPIPAGG